MRKFLRHFSLLIILASSVMSLKAQNAGTINGTVKNSSSAEVLAAVSVTVKGTTNGTYTDDKGTFRLNVSQKTPFTLVFSSVGYTNKEVPVSSINAKLEVSLSPSFVLGSEVVVSASKVAERILESPVSIERISNTTIKNTPASSYYDILGTLKGVDVITASLTFKSISTRGFNVSGNTRANQLIDGMDNQAPGLNFSVGSVIGLTELDVDNIELLPGASSALYGAGGMNGTVLINSKNPFKYQGLSFQVKQGFNHYDNYQRSLAPYKDWTVRWAQKVNDRFAYKFAAQFVEAQDWVGTDATNYSRTTGSQNGQTIPGTRQSDPNYDGVNFYGDETTTSLSSVYGSVKNGIIGSLTAAYAPYGPLAGAYANAAFNQLYGATAMFPTLSTYTAFLKSQNAALAPYAPFLYGNAKGFFGGDVSRTGYAEKDVIDPTTLNVKMTGSFNYKISDNTEASFSFYNGTGNTVYTGSDRYSLKELRMGQYKLEIKSKDWLLRAYTTNEDAGASYNATIAARYFNEAWSPSTTWFPTYMSALTSYRDAGMPAQAATVAARAIADANRPTGNIRQDPRFKSIISTPISMGGGMFLDKSDLNVFEGQYNLTNALGLDKMGADLLVGASMKQYVLNSQGTLFADTAGAIKINETGAYAQLSKKLFDDVVKISASGRYDKSTYFDGRFTPRVSMVVKVAQDNNVRLSYQTAYRFPSSQNQWINLLVGGGTRLMGGLPQLREYYNFATNPAYTLASVNAFGASAMAGAPNTALLKQQVFNQFKPESMTSMEIGYKALIAKKLLLDFYYYTGNYTNFIGGVTVIQSRNAAAPSPLDVLDASKRMAYSISTNSEGDVKTSGWGLSLDYLLPRNFSISTSIFNDEIGTVADGVIPYFNTPKIRANIALNNSGFLFKNRLGFSANFHYQDGFDYVSTFAVGAISSYQTMDAVLTYKIPSYKSLIKAGGTNIFNKYYKSAYGSPAIGALYYVSFAYNIF
jgi:outer membrane receptor protein involved in Fe transport